jgi:flagellar basal body-associated protein FliL
MAAMAEEEEVETEETAEKTALLSGKGIAIIAALLVLEAVLFAGLYMVYQSVSGAPEEEPTIPIISMLEMKQIRTSLKIGVSGKKAFIELNLNFEIDPDHREIITSNYDPLKTIIRAEILEQVIYPIRYEELGTPALTKKIKSQIKKVTNEIMRDRGSKSLPKEPVLDVHITDMRY